MGRPKESWKLQLTNLEGSELPDSEFDMIHEPYFSVGLEFIKVKERQQFSIPGLRTRDVALTQKYLDLKNIFSVKAGFEAAAQLPVKWFVINGSTRVGDLATSVHTEYGLNAGAELQLLADDKVLPYNKLMAAVYKESISSEAFVEVLCRLVDGPDI